jgi:hypothetical protein
MVGVWLAATPLIRTKERRAELLVSDKVSGAVLFKYDFRAVSEDATEVSIRMAWRSSPVAPDNASIDVLKKCGKPPSARPAPETP